jgi:hypothetical protein
VLSWLKLIEIIGSVSETRENTLLPRVSDRSVNGKNPLLIPIIKLFLSPSTLTDQAHWPHSHQN